MDKNQLYIEYIIKDKGIRDIAKQYCISYYAVSELLKKYGIRKIPNLEKFRNNPPSKKEIEKLYIEENKKISEIKDLYGVSDRDISKLLKEYGIKKDFKTSYKVPSKEELDFAYNWKYNSIVALSKFYSIPVQKVKDLIRKYSIKQIPVDKLFLENPPSKEEMEKLYSNYTGRELLGRFKIRGVSISRNAIYEVIKKYGIKKKNKTEQFLENPPSKEEFEKIYLSKDIDDTAHYYHVQQYAIKELIARYNIVRQSSKEEVEILNYFPHLKTGVCGLLSNKYQEIDFVDYSKKLGIEFNGSYWHSEDFKNKFYHMQKSLDLAKKEMFLYHIFEYDWLDRTKKQIMLSQLENLLGQNKNKIFARNCVLKQVFRKEEKEFLQKNHLQGYTSSKLCLGLYHNNQLVGLMSFGKPRFNSKYEWELLRYCVLCGTSLVGGASKLFRFFLKATKAKTVLSYSDFSKARGSLYEKLGFVFQYMTEPNYVWYGHSHCLSRYQCQKHKLVKQGFDPNKTEVEIMHERGYRRIWDCGNKVWAWNNPEYRVKTGHIV